MGYTVQYAQHKGWPAVLGLLGVAVGLLQPVVTVLPYHAQVIIGAISAIVLAYTNPPGALKQPNIGFDPSTSPSSVNVTHTNP